MRTDYQNIVKQIEDLTPKQKAELLFWDNEINNYVLWYKGIKRHLYQTPTPTAIQKIQGNNYRQAAILTWTELHQKNKYLYDLDLSPESFRNKKVLDIGSGPIPSATCFKECELYALDPLNTSYEILGFPHDLYPKVHFITAQAEQIPFPDNFFDAVISVNAIDHVDNFEKAASEICRVIKLNGKFAMHVHYHSATMYEPIELNDQRFQTAFSNIPNLYPVKRSIQSFSNILSGNESFVLWKNY